MFLQFVSAATGIASAVSVFDALRKGSHNTQGNFYNFFLKSITPQPEQKSIHLVTSIPEQTPKNVYTYS